MAYEGKKNTDKWFPVVLLDDTDFKTPETGIAYTDITVKYHTEAATSQSTYSVASGNWAEAGEGQYWLQIGASEFTAENKYEVSVSATGCLTHRFAVEVNDKTKSEMIDILDSIAAKLPSKSYIAGSDNSDGDVELDDATGSLPSGAFSNLPNVNLADDAITAAKFDESTAFPITSADSGSTQIARTGADGDTLETLSDEIAVIDGNVDSVKSTVDTNLDAAISSRGTANPGDEMALVNDAITASKYDESTAFPIVSSDSGLTQIARTGADGDTLETISDEIVSISSVWNDTEKENIRHALGVDGTKTAPTGGFGRIGNPTDTDLATDIANVTSDTEDIQSKIGTPSTTLSADIAGVQSTANDIEADTQDIQTNIGTPVGTISSDIAGVQSIAVDIETDTQDIQAKIGTPVLTLSSDIAGVQSTSNDIETDTQDIQAKIGIPSVDLSTDILAVQSTSDAIEIDTQDIQLKIGTPAGVSVSADIASIQSDTDSIQSTLGTPAGADISADIASIQSTADNIETDTQDIQSKIGAPVALDGGLATLGGMITKLADDNGGLDYDATTDSLHESVAGSASWTSSEKEQIRDALGIDGDKTTATGGQVQSIETKIDTVDTVVDGIDSKVDTAQSDLDTITGSDGAILATTQPYLNPAVAGDEMNLADNAITSGKYDEITAFPIKQDDSGSSAIARVGADEDTLETISDQIDGVQTSVDGIQNNTRFVATIPGNMVIPESGNTMYRLTSHFYDSDGNMEDPDNNEIAVVFKTVGGTSKVSFYDDSAATTPATASTTFSGKYKMVRLGVGIYETYYQLPNTESEGQWVSEFSLEEDSVQIDYARTTVLSDESLGTVTLADNSTNKQIVAEGVLATPANKLSTDANGRVDVSLIEGVDATDQIESSAGSAILATPANKIEIDTDGRVDVGSWAGEAVGVGATSGLPAVDSQAISDSTSAADSVESNIGNLDESISTVDGKVDTIDTVVDSIASDVTTVDGKVDNIQTDITTIDGIVDSIQVDTNSIESKIDTVDSVVDGIAVDVSGIDSKIDTAQSDLDTITGADGVTLATSQANYAPAKAGDEMAITPSELADIVDAIWDELASGHTGVLTMGGKLNLAASGSTSSLHEGLATGGTSNTITLDAGASSTNDLYDPGIIVITGGTGAGQCRSIMSYNGSTKVASVSRNWRVNPDATSQFRIITSADHTHTNEGLAQSGGASTITLNANASSVDNEYVGQIIQIRSGTGEDQVRYIESYVGATKVATVNRVWDTTPDSTSGYAIIPLLIGEAETDWSNSEKSQIRQALGITGTVSATETGDLQAVQNDVNQIEGYLTDGTNGLAAIQSSVGGVQATADDIEADTQNIQANIGSPHNIDGKGATLSDNIGTLAGPAYGSAFDEDLHSLQKIRENMLNLTANELAQWKNALGMNNSGTTAAGGQLQTIDDLIDAIKSVTDLIPDNGSMSSIAQEATLGSPSGVSLSADIATVLAAIGDVDTDINDGTNGLTAIKTAINNIPASVLAETLDGSANVSTALQHILSYCVGNINRVGSVYTYRDFDNTSDRFTVTGSTGGRSRS